MTFTGSFTGRCSGRGWQWDPPHQIAMPCCVHCCQACFHTPRNAHWKVCGGGSWGRVGHCGVYRHVQGGGHWSDSAHPPVVGAVWQGAGVHCVFRGSAHQQALCAAGVVGGRCLAGGGCPPIFCTAYLNQTFSKTHGCSLRCVRGECLVHRFPSTTNLARCTSKRAEYTCPRCNTRYCTLACYKTHNNRCTNQLAQYE